MGGLLLVVSSPSGAGKTTLCRRLVASHPALRFSVSYTTRAQRPDEIPGVDYNFVSEEGFSEMVTRGDFAEWAHVHGRRYGTAISMVRDALDHGGQVLFDVDYQGAERLRERFPDEVCTVFILPPSIASLERRLRSRGTEVPGVIKTRLFNARTEIAHYTSYRYLIINDNLERAYSELEAIYLFERHRHLGGPAPPKSIASTALGCSLERRGNHAEALLAEGSDS